MAVPLNRSLLRSATMAASTASALAGPSVRSAFLATPRPGPSAILSSSSLRALSTSVPRLVPRPQTGPTQIANVFAEQVDPKDAATMTLQDSMRMANKRNPAAAYPDYSKGPSALDKAGNMFFFTEILRGESLWRWALGRLRLFVDQTDRHCSDLPSHQACGLSSRTSSDRPTPSCTHSRRVHCPHDSVASTPCEDTRAVRSDASHANSAKPFAQHKPSPSNRSQEKTAHDAQPDTTSI